MNRTLALAAALTLAACGSASQEPAAPPTTETTTTTPATTTTVPPRIAETAEWWDTDIIPIILEIDLAISSLPDDSTPLAFCGVLADLVPTFLGAAPPPHPGLRGTWTRWTSEMAAAGMLCAEGLATGDGYLMAAGIDTLDEALPAMESLLAHYERIVG